MFGRLSYEVGSGFELFAEASYNKQRVQFNAGPNLSSCTTLSAGNIGAASTLGGCTLAANNAFLIQTLGAAQLVGITGVGIGTTSADLPYRGVDNRREVQRYTIGAEGSFNLFGKPAPWNIYGQYGQAKLREQLRDIMQLQRTANAVNAVFAAAGNPGGYAPGTIVCAINVDATTANDDRACVPLNRLGVGVANPAALSYFLGDPYRDETLKQYVTGANLSFTPFATWAGDVSIAVGAEYRKESIRGFVPQQFQPLITRRPRRPECVNLTTNLWSVGNYLPSNGKYNVKEAYLEAVVPLGLRHRGQRRSARHRLFELGQRHDVEGRGDLAADRRCALPRDAFARHSRAQPRRSVRGRLVQQRRDQQPAAGTGAALNGVTYASNSISYSATVTGNPNLAPEKANTWNIGAVFTPTFIPGSECVGRLFPDRCGRRDRLAQRAGDRQSLFPRKCGLLRRDPAGPGQPGEPCPDPQPAVQLRPPAGARLRLRCLLSHPDRPHFRQHSNAAVTLRGLATYYLDNVTDQGIANTLIFDTVGVNGGQGGTPKWIFRVNATYETPNFSLTATGRGISSGKFLANTIECTTELPAAAELRRRSRRLRTTHLPGLFYVDLNLTQKVTIDNRSWGQFFINVTNVFNKSPLVIPDTGLAANSTYSDLLGRQFRVGFRAEFK